VQNASNIIGESRPRQNRFSELSTNYRHSGESRNLGTRLEIPAFAGMTKIVWLCNNIQEK